MDSKYSILSVQSLVRIIQEAATKLEDPKQKKKLSTATCARLSKDLNDMRYAVQEKLKKLNRESPLFFPINSIIIYENALYQTGKKEGKVIGYQKDKCIVKLDSELFPIAVDPMNLLLKFIRIKY